MGGFNDIHILSRAHPSNVTAITVFGDHSF
jgi:hypothetical protein